MNTMNTLTIIDSKDKKTGDVLVRKQDYVIAGFVKESGGLDLHTDDMDLQVIWARPESPVTEYSNRTWNLNGQSVTETVSKVSRYMDNSNGRLKKV